MTRVLSAALIGCFVSVLLVDVAGLGLASLALLRAIARVPGALAMLGLSLMAGLVWPICARQH